MSPSRFLATGPWGAEIVPFCSTAAAAEIASALFARIMAGEIDILGCTGVDGAPGPRAVGLTPREIAETILLSAVDNRPGADRVLLFAEFRMELDAVETLIRQALASAEAARDEAVRRARAEALEEAARVADGHYRGVAGAEDPFRQGAEAQARIIAREIRALTSEGAT